MRNVTWTEILLGLILITLWVVALSEDIHF